MYEYEFATVKVNTLTGNEKENPEDIIKEKAKQGWRLHSYVPLPFYTGGQARSIKLVFEKEVK